MFVKEDIYTSSGTTKLWRTWTANVTKHDTSSFYNWEQDNEPLYDLEERSYFNWEQHGYPLSCIPGLSLTVSADAPANVTGCNTNIFATVSAAMAALPQTLYFPVIIEVANFGDLGLIKLDNIKMGHRGSLEIINRNFHKLYSISSIAYGQHASVEGGGPANMYNLVGAISSLDLSNTFFGGSPGVGSLSALEVSANVWSATNDTRVPNNYNVITQCVNSSSARGPRNEYPNEMNHRLSVSLRSPNIRGYGAADNLNTNVFLASAYESSPLGTDQLTPADCSTTTDPIPGNNGGTELFRDWDSVDRDKAVSLVYGNFSKGIRVRNCDGPLYIRGFLVDGTYTNSVGFNVDGCSELILENCASVRNTKNGFEINNSDVTITRGIVGYRNYNTVAGSRDYSQVSISAWDYDSLIEPYPGNGLEANNSKLHFSSTLSFENTYLPSPGASAVDFLCNFSRNTRGIVLNNSKLTGGINRLAAQDLVHSSRLVLELNVDKGLEANNSEVKLDGVLDIHGNGKGAVVKNSLLELDHLNVHHNQHRGLHLVGSDFRYNKNKYAGNYTRTAYDFSGNGQHLIVDKNSSMGPVYFSGMDTNGYAMSFQRSFGRNLTTASLTKHAALYSPISVRNNSNATFLQTRIRQTSEDIPGSFEAQYGAAIEVRDNSKAKFQGTGTRCTLIEGPDTETEQQRRAAVYAGDNSVVEFNGPTAIYQWAVDVLAENNSTMNFNPPRNEIKGGYDSSTFNLEDYKNHTAIELHSTRACIVAKNNSIINMRDLGDFFTHWSAYTGVGAGQLISNGNEAILNGCDYKTSGGGTNTDLITSAGYMQFYPNANEPSMYTEGLALPTANAKAWPVNGDAQFASDTTHLYTNKKKLYYLTDYYRGGIAPDSYSEGTGANTASAITTGGMCLRAVDESVVNARNINFPCGFSQPSGLYYDISAVANNARKCHRLHIWNIAGNSRLNASYLSVSGIHPEDNLYHGPSAVYGGNIPANTASGNAAGYAFYGAPSGTPDTSTLSVLDFYGPGALHNIAGAYGEYVWPDGDGGLRYRYGTQGGTNKGAFRLYVDVDPVINQLKYARTDLFGATSGNIIQIYAQGYNFSGSLSANDYTTSALYGKVLSFAAPDQNGYYGTKFELGSSGFHYCSSMVSPDTYKRILLDESAANTFANAKNGAMGSSGRPQICTIYKAHTKLSGESAGYGNKDAGIGFKSPNEFDLDRDN